MTYNKIMKASNEEKLYVIRELLKERHSSVQFTFVPNERCFIPKHLSDRKVLNFQVGYFMQIPIPDLLINDEGISGTLSFNGVPEYVFVPWECIYVAHRGEGRARTFYNFGVTADVAHWIEEDTAARNVVVPAHRDAIRPASPEVDRSHLQVVEGGKKTSFLDKVKRGPLSDRSHLRVVQD